MTDWVAFAFLLHDLNSFLPLFYLWHADLDSEPKRQTDKLRRRLKNLENLTFRQKENPCLTIGAESEKKYFFSELSVLILVIFY